MDEQDQMIHQLYQTTRAISKGLNQRLEPAGIYTSEWTILKILKEQEALTQIALANYLNVEPAAISKTLVKLEKKELVVRQVGQDKREKIISLTAKAQESYEMWQQIVGEHRRQFLQDISAEQLTLMRRLLQTMAKHAK